MNGTENNGSSENERTTVSYGSKTQSAGAKAGKRVGMVMDSGKRLKDRMNLAKENVKNTPTEIKYHAGLHRKAMEQNVKDFKEGIAGERNRRETGRLQERNRIRADAGKKRREMYLTKRRNETALKRYDGIDIHQRIPVNGKELGTYGTMLNSTDQEKFRKDLHQQRNEDHGLQERNGGQSVRETETGTESVPGRTIIRSGGNAKDLRSDVLAERRSAGHAEPHVKKITGLKKDDRRTDRRK